MVGLETEQDFRDLVIARGTDGHLVRLGEVADVQLAAEERAHLQRIDGVPGVGIQVEAQSKANMLEIVRRHARRRRTHAAGLPQGTTLEVSVDNAIAIEAALREVVIALGARVRRPCSS